MTRSEPRDGYVGPKRRLHPGIRAGVVRRALLWARQWPRRQVFRRNVI